MRDACVALLSDFGSRDPFAGVMKGVIAGIAPSARLIDLTHEIPPGDVRLAAFRLWQALPHMPPGTVFLAVVDPGVGTTRRPVAVRCRGFSCVGPDNGVFTYVLAGRSEARAVEISPPGLSTLRRGSAGRPGARPASHTFHGRDVFAPAAGLLASGMKLERLGPEAGDLLRIPWPRLARDDNEGSIRGEVLFADRFGNAVTSIGRLTAAGNTMRLEPWIQGCSPLDLISTRLRVRLTDGREVPLARAYGEVPEGEALAYIGSDGLLEIGVNRGSATDSLGLSAGKEISLLWL